jgi:hypothetical protein
MISYAVHEIRDRQSKMLPVLILILTLCLFALFQLLRAPPSSSEHLAMENIPEVGRKIAEIGGPTATGGVRGVLTTDLEKYLDARHSTHSSIITVMSAFNIVVFAGMNCPKLAITFANQLNHR